ncbi:hypothetical protein ACHAXH_000051 [Discostella pseudostelligera]
MSTACVSPVQGTDAEVEEGHTSVDSAVALGKNDGMPASVDGLPHESIVAINTDVPISNQTQRETDDGALKLTSVESDIESGVGNDEQSNNHEKEQRQRPSNEQLVMDSDEGSIGPPSEGHRRREKGIYSGESDEELDNPTDVNHYSTTTFSRPGQTDTRSKSLSVSSAALAAIEAARIEAEQMIAQSHSDETQMKREKKSKKKKDKEGKKSDKEGKKKKKKDKRHDTHSLASQN